MTGDCCVFRFLRRTMNGHICVFRMKPPFSNFPGVNGAFNGDRAGMREQILNGLGETYKRAPEASTCNGLEIFVK